MYQILIVDNEEKFCKIIKAAMELEDIPCDYRTSGFKALDFLKENNVDIVISDLRMDGMDGIELLEQIKSRHQEIEVIIMTAFATQKSALEALKKGANDYLIKPFEMDELFLRVTRIIEQKQILLENKYLRETRPEPIYFDTIIGKSRKMQEVYQLIKKASEVESTVLIRGESGTGKELVAKMVQKLSARSGKNMITVNCAALPDNLLESELFGYERGAFTGAAHRRIGKFEESNGSSIFLDEIGDMSISTQAKILRVLQNKEIYRLGGNEKIEVDVRVLAATHQDLEKMVEDGKFRKDLYYRLNVFPIHIPPLRERKEDIPSLVHHFLKDTEAKGISRSVLALLMEYDFPGNIRELQNIIERTAILCNGVIENQDLPSIMRLNTGESSSSIRLPDEGIDLDDLEKELIVQAIRNANGNKTKAAELLGITRRRLYSMMERFHIF
jgi:DNA-binding NtrC family response regulator